MIGFWVGLDGFRPNPEPEPMVIGFSQNPSDKPVNPIQTENLSTTKKLSYLIESLLGVGIGQAADRGLWPGPLKAWPKLAYLVKRLGLGFLNYLIS